jgi:undecaprenyl pyrophosphate phosphatase UppP
VAGASILSLPDIAADGMGIGVAPLVAGFASAAIVGVLAIQVFIVMLKNRSFPLFAGYLAFLGVGFLLWLQNS